MGIKIWVAVACVAATVGCSDDEQAGSDSQTGAIKESAGAYSDAYLTGDADAAYALLSKRCRDRMTAGDFAGLVAVAADEYGTALPLDTFSAEVNGSQARVTYTYADHPEINQTDEPWVKESGKWHEDDC